MRFLLSFILLYSTSAFGQSEWKELFRLKEKAEYIAIDNLNNIYSVNQSELDKYDSEGKFQFRYSDKQLGNIGSLDVTYPLRPLLLYIDLNYTVLLDNTLSNNRGRTNLMDHDIGLATAACASVENHFWFFDMMNFSLIRTDDNFLPVRKTGNLSQLLGIELQPTFMVEFANKLYMNNPETGILVFDVFGTYIKTIPIKGLDHFQVFDNEIVYFEDAQLVRYNPMIFQSRIIEIPMSCEMAYFNGKNRIILKQKDEIVVLSNNP